MRSRVGPLVLFTALSFLPVNGMAQGLSSQMGSDFDSRVVSPQSYRVIAGKVCTLRGDPIVHATVQITNNVGFPVRNLLTDNHGEFRSEYYVFSQGLEAKHFTVTLQVTKKNFQVAHRFADMGESQHNIVFGITLSPRQPEDPSLLSQVDLINAVAPRLRQLGPADGLSAKEEKDYARAVHEFLDRNHADGSVPDFARVAKLDPSCLRCRTMLALAELSWGDWDDARNELGESINALIAHPKLGGAEPLLTYGTLLTWGHEPYKASACFLEALKYAPQDALALRELGRVQCLDLNWYAANETLKKALAAGAGPEARLMRAEALVWAGTPDEASAELKLYLDGRGPKDISPRVRTIQANIQARRKDEAAFFAANAKAQARGEQPLDYLHHPPQNLPDFEPAADQAPMGTILAAVGRNVAELIDNLPQICSVETVRQERLTRKGKAVKSQEYKYRYLALAPNTPWGPAFDEYRADLTGAVISQLGLSGDSMLTSGFVSAPLVFHPDYQSGSSFRLLGREKVKGRNTFVIAYAQEPTKSRLSGCFQQADTMSTTYNQGLAWIDAENYQIIRLTSDLLRPLPLVKLEQETTDIEFSDVQFKRPAQRFWLPEAVTVTLHWNGVVYRNQHAYSDFRVSAVESTQKIGTPKGVEKALREANDAPPNTHPLESQPLSFVPPAK